MKSTKHRDGMTQEGDLRRRISWVSGGCAGLLEIGITYPFEFSKCQLQLQQKASAIAAADDTAVRYRGFVHCLSHTVRAYGVSGLYRGCDSWFLFAFPRSAVRFSVFEQLSHYWVSYGQERSMLVDMAIGTIAGAAEGALCQTPNQSIQIKMVHDMSSGRARQYLGFGHAVRSIYRTHGLRNGFFCGVYANTLKVAVNTSIRFTLYNYFIAHGFAHGTVSSEPSVAQSLMAGGLAGGVSAVVSQPIDTVKANMMGLESLRYKSAFHCARRLVEHGGVACLYHGLQPRVIRVVLEVALQFAFYEQISKLIAKTIRE